MIVKKGEIYYANLSGTIGSEQSGKRPVIIIQNDIGNKYSPTTIVAAITTHKKKKHMPTHVSLTKNCGLNQQSIVLLEQIRTIDKERLGKKIGICSKKTLININKGIKKSFFLTDKILLEGEIHND
jgi:mRNA interferase MazF